MQADEPVSQLNAEPAPAGHGPSGDPASSPAMGGELGRLAGRGALWSAITQVTQQLLSVVATVVLARLLTPGDFGVVAASLVIQEFVQLSLSRGWQTAIIRRDVVGDAYLSSVFWLLGGVGLAAVAFIGVAAPFLARLVGLPGAGVYIAVLGLALIPTAATIVPTGLLQRRLELKALSLASIVSFSIYVIVQLGLAARGAGPWAVITGLVIQPVVLLFGVCVGARWWPRLHFQPRLIAEDFRFANGLLLNNGLTYGVRNADYWVVGRTLGAAALGAYYVAYVLPQILRLRVTWAVGQVLLPVLAKSRSDRELTLQVYYHASLLIAWVGVPAMVGLAVIADPVVLVFFGPQWEAAVAPLRWLAFVALLEFVTFGPTVGAMTYGEVRRLMATNVVRLVVLALSVVVMGTLFRSVEAVAAGVLVATLLGAIHQQVTLARPLGLAFRPLLRGLSAIGFLSVVVGVVVAVLLTSIEMWHPILQIAACTSVGAVSYFALGHLLFRELTVPLARSVHMIVRSGGSPT